MAHKTFADFLNESDSEDTPRHKGAAGGLGDLKRPAVRPVSAMSSSTAASDDGGMMIGGVRVRMPGQSRPNSATSAATLSRPTSAVSTAPWPPAPPSSFGRGEGQRETSRSPIPDQQPPMFGLGPTDSLPGRSKSPAPDEMPRKGMLGLGPTDSLRGRSKSPAPDEMPKKGMLGLGPTDSLRGRSKSPAPDEMPKKGMLELGPTDSLRDRSKSPAPDEMPKKGLLGPAHSSSGRSKSPAPDRLGPMDRISGPPSGRIPAPWEQPSPMGSRTDVPFPPGSAPVGGRVRPGSAARSREAPAPPMAPPSTFQPPPPMDIDDLRDDRSIESDDAPKKKKDKKEKKEKKSKKEKKEKKERKEREEREEEERRLRLQEREEQEKKAQKERKKEEKRLQKQKEKEERQREENRKKEPVSSDDEGAVSVGRPAMTEASKSQPRTSVPPTSTRPKQSHLKTGRPRIRRFLLTFDPLGLTVVWEKNGQRKATALHVDPEELEDVSSQRSFAKRLVKKWDFLQDSHTTQIEVLLQRLALRVLPVYRVESPKALATWEAPNGSTSQGSLFLPAGSMFLVVERTRCVDGWWLRLASGKRWVPEVLKDEVVCATCNPSVSQATEALRSLRIKQRPSNVLERNARLVCSQLQKQQAPVESKSLS